MGILLFVPGFVFILVTWGYVWCVRTPGVLRSALVVAFGLAYPVLHIVVSIEAGQLGVTSAWSQLIPGLLFSPVLVVSFLYLFSDRWCGVIPAVAAAVAGVAMTVGWWAGDDMMGVLYAFAGWWTVMFAGLLLRTSAMLRAQRRRAPACCQNCGYSLQGLTRSICPECGKRVRAGRFGAGS